MFKPQQSNPIADEFVSADNVDLGTDCYFLALDT